MILDVRSVSSTYVRIYVYVHCTIYIRRPPGPSGRAEDPSLPFYTLPSSLLWSLVPLVHSSVCFPVLEFHSLSFFVLLALEG